MSMRSILCCLFWGVAASMTLTAGDIAPSLLSGGFWQEKPETELNGVRYAPVDETHIRIPRGFGLTIGSLKFGETLLEFNEDKVPASLTIMIYNKGDDGTVGKAEYEGYIKESKDALNEIFGVEGKPFRVSKKDAGLQVQAWQWVWEGGAARLECSATGGGKQKKSGRAGKNDSSAQQATGFQPEFIRLKIGADVDALERGGASDTIGRSKLKGQIEKGAKSCVINGIPMVDQGQKGYCVPATLSRLFAYYGMDGVDQHALAALCKSSGEGGTSMQGMEAALKDISTAFHIRLQTIPLKPLLKEYNKSAKKIGAKELTQEYIDHGFLFEEPVLKDMMDGRNASALLKKWMAPVTKSIDAGVPVVWSVMLGIYPEQGLPQAGGGHMRMIIGYDWEKEELIYSDSWGSGHEKKSMPMKNAFVITKARYILKPSR